MLAGVRLLWAAQPPSHCLAAHVTSSCTVNQLGSCIQAVLSTYKPYTPLQRSLPKLIACLVGLLTAKEEPPPPRGSEVSVQQQFFHCSTLLAVCECLLRALLCLHQEENTTSLARVKKDARLMPPLVFSMEEWERKLVSTGKSAGKNLLRDAKRSFCRDFKVKTAADPQGRPQQQQQAAAGAGGQQARSQQAGRARGGGNARHSQQQQPAASRGSRGSAGSHGRGGSGAGGSSRGGSSAEQEAAGGGEEDEEMGAAAEGSEEHGDNDSHGGMHGEEEEVEEEQAVEEENHGRQQQLGGRKGKAASKGAHKASRGSRAPLQRTQV